MQAKSQLDFEHRTIGILRRIHEFVYCKMGTGWDLKKDELKKGTSNGDQDLKLFDMFSRYEELINLIAIYRGMRPRVKFAWLRMWPSIF